MEQKFRLELPVKWRRTRLTLSKSNNDVYKPETPVPPVSEGRPELGNKAAKAMGPPVKHLVASIDVCLADAKTHAVRREEKADRRWKEHFKKVGVKIDILKLKSSAAVASETVATTKRNTDLAFLMGGNTAAISPAVLALYLPLAEAILS